MAILNTTVVETVIQNKINNLTTASSVVDVVLPITATNLDIGLSSSVATSNDLPNVAGLSDGHVVFVRDINMHVVASQNQWLSFDGRLFKYATGSSPWPLWAWGANIYGQLGNNSVVDKSIPVSIAGIFTDWCQVSAGRTHTTALRTHGTLWSWGNNNGGRLGNNNNIIVRSSPVSIVSGFIDWCQVSAGGAHAAAVRTNGTLWAWGCNESGQLGDNTLVSKLSPVQIVSKFQVSSGNGNVTAVIVDGAIWQSGNNAFGQLGDNTIVSKRSPVSVVGGFTDWCQVSASTGHAAAVRTNGTLWAWGWAGQGQLGDNTIINKSSPVSVVGGFTNWCQVSTGDNNTAAVRTNGTLWTWGSNTVGQLGDNTTVSKSSPVQVSGGFTNWCQVAVGKNHMVAIRTVGTAWAWGNSLDGRLGNNTTVNRSSPVSVVGGFTDWCQISVSYGSTTALRTNGTIWTWGNNSCGQLGDNTTVTKSSPVSVVGGFTDWCRVSAGQVHAVAVRTNGTIWAWGYNVQGQLGDNTIVNKSSPVQVVGGFSDWCQVSAGNLHTAAVRTNGTIWTWGRGTSGQLGDNTVGNKSSPVSVVGGFSDWCQVSAGSYNTAAIRPNGTLLTWGDNGGGQLGNNAGNVIKCTPLAIVGGFTDWCTVSVGRIFMAAIRTSGTLWSWGYNGHGQLGDNTDVNRGSPVSVVGGFTDWCQVSAAANHIAAVRTNGTLWTWGRNDFGQLGDNTSVSKRSPVSVVGGFTDWCQVSAGGCNTAAIRTNGTLWTWGWNNCGQLGDNTIVNKSSPISVVSEFTDWCQVSAGYGHTAAIRINT